MTGWKPLIPEEPVADLPRLCFDDGNYQRVIPTSTPPPHTQKNTIRQKEGIKCVGKGHVSGHEAFFACCKTWAQGIKGFKAC